MKVASHCYPVRASNSAVNVRYAVSHLAVPEDLKRLAEISDYVLAFIVSGHRANAASVDRPNDGNDRPNRYLCFGKAFGRYLDNLRPGWHVDNQHSISLRVSA